MARPPGVHVVEPGIGAGLDGAEVVIAVRVGDRPAAAAEIRVERAEVDVLLVAVAARGVGLPDLDQRVGHRPAVFVEHAAVDDDALAHRHAAVLEVHRQVVVERAEVVMAEGRAGDLGRGLLQGQKRCARGAGDRGLVDRGMGRRMQGAVTFVEVSGLHLGSPSVRRGFHLGEGRLGDLDRMVGARHAGVDRDMQQRFHHVVFAGAGVGGGADVHGKLVVVAEPGQKRDRQHRAFA